MKMTLLVVGIVALSLIAAGAYAQHEGGGQSKSGTVQKVDLEAKTITVDFGPRPLTLKVTDTTKIVQGDAAKTLADIKAGAKVTVVYHKDGESRVADKITITG